jgi:vacuolar iron transporter family protein
VTTDQLAVADTISEIFTTYDLPPALVSQLTTHLTSSPHAPSFLMRFSHQLPEPAPSRALTCALTIALGYFIGGFVPLVPYFFVSGENAVYEGLAWSAGVMVCALFGFGYVKTALNSGWRGRGNFLAGARGGGEMVVVGGVAAGAAMGLVKAFGCWEGTV